jgi:protein tyrosine phosphatase (PTP) superfamily phosphohydrolase (DUF442 family)
MALRCPLYTPVLIAMIVAGTSCAPHKVSPATTQPLATPRDIPGVRNFAWVTAYLCRGGQPDAVGFGQLKAAGVKTVVDLRGKSHRDEVESLGLKYVQIPSSAAKPDRQQVVEFLRLARDVQNRPVFVHDEAGADRVGLYLAAFRIVEQGWTPRDAGVEMNGFHFNPYWAQVSPFLNQLDVESIRRELAVVPTTTTATTPKKPR